MRGEMKESLGRYAEHGVPTGGFLRAVLANDLMGAFGRADMFSIEELPEICGYIYNDMPGQCHGSYEMVDAWIEEKRQDRMAEAKRKETE